ncbi:MAG: hypothetical protein C4320_10180, partial [Armatimonadota bacterium]
ALLSPPAEYAFADPSRRRDGTRVRDAEEFSPPLSALLLRIRRRMGLKLSPMLPDTVLEGLGGELEFISFRGECREALVWLGEDVGTGRSAVLIPGSEPLRTTVLRVSECPAPAAAREPGEFLYDADPALVRAHALGGFPLLGLGDSPGYLTGGEVVSPWLRGYRVVTSGAFDPKRVRRLGRRIFEVKRRGVPDDADRAARGLIGANEGPRASLILYRTGRSVRFVLGEAL